MLSAAKNLSALTQDSCTEAVWPEAACPVAMTRDAPEAHHTLHNTLDLVTLGLFRELLFVAGGALEQKRIGLELAVGAKAAFDDRLGVILE